MLYVMICYKSMTSDYCFHTSNILKSNKHYLYIQNISSFQIKTESVQVILKCKNTLLSTKLFQNVICNDMLQINDLRLLFSYFKYSQKQKTSSQNHKISSFEIKKESIQVILKCKNTLLSTKLFQNVICNDELQINDLRLLFSYFKYSHKTINIISKSQNFLILNQKKINTR